MAWLSGITGKAESFLNSLDQKAAHVLTEETNPGLGEATLAQPGHAPSGSTQSTSHDPFLGKPKPSISSSQTVPSAMYNYKEDQSKDTKSGGAKPKTDTTPKKKTNATDEALFEFLNSSDPAERRKSTPANSTRHSRQSSSSSVISNKGGKNNDGQASSSTSGSSMVHVEMPEDPGAVQDTSTTSLPGGGSDSRGSPAEMDMAALEDAMQDQSPSNSVHSNQELESHDHHDDDNPMSSSSMDLENRLLKGEIASLNQEMASLVQRAKDSETEMGRLRHKLSDQSRSVSRTDLKVRELQNREQDLVEAVAAKDSQLAILRVRLEEADKMGRLRHKLSDQSRSVSRTDQTVRELQNREQDLVEAVAAKDSQLAILRVRLEEADRDIQGFKNATNELKADRQRILRDHTDSSGIHGQALDSLRQKLTEVEGALQREKEANKMSQQEAVGRQARLEEEQKSFTGALTAAEKKHTEEKAKVQEMGNQLKAAKTSLDAAKQELSEYKEKATRILQSKERLIASLREGSGAAGEASGVSSLEYDTVKQERDMFKEEIQQARMALDNCRLEIADLESQLQQENDTAQENLRSLEDNVGEEKQRREDAEQELLKQKKELQYAIEELNRQKTSFQSRMNDREEEISRLRTQLATKSMSTTTESELESRVRELTESLIQKQTMVEALSTEKNSLGLQLERLGQQYKDIQASAMRTNTTVIPVHDDDEVRQRLPMFMREGPTDTEVTRKMKRAANTIDKFSIRLGVFLRRYPIARVFVIIYMVLLHLWVMVVLLTYQPEIHGSDALKMPAAPDMAH